MKILSLGLKTEAHTKVLLKKRNPGKKAYEELKLLWDCLNSLLVQ